MGKPGRQVYFFMLPADQLEFENWLITSHDVYFIKERLKSREPEFLSTLVVQEMRRTPVFDIVYLARKADIKHLFFRQVSDDCWTVDYWLSAVVEFRRCYFDGEILRNGCLYFRPTAFLVDSYQTVRKQEKFIKWGDKLLRWIRRRYEPSPMGNWLIGPHAKKWFLEEGGRLTQI